MNSCTHKDIIVSGDSLLDRVVSILEQARTGVIRAVNTSMVQAYWLIGKEIVQEIQNGDDRAEYGKQIIEKLSLALTEKYGRGFSTTNIRYFRTFYTVYSNRFPEIRHIECGELGKDEKHHIQSGILQDMRFAVENADQISGFSDALGWSHYRALMKIENANERVFYEIEAEKENWDVKHLERQINTLLFARLMKSHDKTGVMELTRKGHIVKKPSDVIKNPYILDFLGLPESERLNESQIEQAIINNIQSFLLELGKGFAFVSRQKRISTETKEFYIDLVFYNYHLKCFILIDIKTGELTHQDVGQMDMYVRMFDDLQRGEHDNPTAGIILCRNNDKTIVKYSMLNENKQLFASKYMMYLPAEDELVKELENITSHSTHSQNLNKNRET
jgi:predicted nuclease of restriction endonuclease-like (RecB) superfamily